MKAEAGECFACDTYGVVLSIMGESRPCSRCRPNDFKRWYEAGVKQQKEK